MGIHLVVGHSGCEGGGLTLETETDCDGFKLGNFVKSFDVIGLVGGTPITFQLGCVAVVGSDTSQPSPDGTGWRKANVICERREDGDRTSDINLMTDLEREGVGDPIGEISVSGERDTVGIIVL